MHLHNIELGKKGSPKFESRFGFHVETCCGSIPQRNRWDSSWTVRHMDDIIHNYMDTINHMYIIHDYMENNVCHLFLSF